jgi:hypothetical protein
MAECLSLGVSRGSYEHRAKRIAAIQFVGLWDEIQREAIRVAHENSFRFPTPPSDQTRSVEILQRSPHAANLPQPRQGKRRRILRRNAVTVSNCTTTVAIPNRNSADLTSASCGFRVVKKSAGLGSCVVHHSERSRFPCFRYSTARAQQQCRCAASGSVRYECPGSHLGGLECGRWRA